MPRLLIPTRAHEAAGVLITNLGMAVLVSGVHSVAMIAAGGASAWLVTAIWGSSRGAELVQSDATWAFSLMLVALSRFAINLASWH